MISINKTKSGQFFVRIAGKNNEILMNGEPLKTKASAKKQIKSLRNELDNGETYNYVRDNTLKTPKDIYI